MPDGDRQLLRYLLEDAATTGQAIGMTWTTPDGWERHETGIPRTVPDTAIATIDAFFALDLATTVEAIYLDATVRVWVPDKPGETLWP